MRTNKVSRIPTYRQCDALSTEASSHDWFSWIDRFEHIRLELKVFRMYRELRFTESRDLLSLLRFLNRLKEDPIDG